MPEMTGVPDENDIVGAGGLVDLNGTRLYHTVEGRGEAVLLVHGFGLDHRQWEPQLGPLRRSHRIVRVDLRGFGRSADPEDSDYSSVDDLIALLDHLEIDRAHVAGLSMGGGIAAELAIARPERVSSLICADAAIGGFGWSPAFLDVLRGVVELAGNGDLATARSSWLDCEMFRRARTQPGVDALLRDMVGDFGGWHWRMRRDPLDRHCIDALHHIRARTLIVAGEHDTDDFMTIATRIAEQVPDSGFVVVENAGHLSNLENPGAFNRALIEFITS